MSRICKGCRTSIRHKHPNAKFCGRRCKDRYWNRVNPRGYGVRSVEAQYVKDNVASFNPSWDGHKDTF